MSDSDEEAAAPLLAAAGEAGGAAGRAGPAGRAAKQGWLRRWLAVAGPGLVVMLADTDAGCLLAAGQTGARWGFTLVPLQLALWPVLVLAQELALRLGALTGRGLPELVRDRYSARWAWAVAVAVALTCAGAVVTEISGVVGVGRLYGVPDLVSAALAAAFLGAVVLTGSYRRAEAVAVVCGLFELVYVWTAWRVAPSAAQLAGGGALDPVPLRSPGFLYIVSAQVGAVLMPWCLIYAQSAVVERGLRARDLGPARVDTAVGGLLTQAVMGAVIITVAGSVWDGHLPSSRRLDSVEDMSRALTAHLGETSGKLLFSLGMLGGAMVGAIVSLLTAAWTLGEVAGFSRSLEKSPSQAPWLYAVYAATLLAAVAACLSGVNLVSLSVAVQVLNAVILPVVLYFLYDLAAALPAGHRPGGWHRAALVSSFSVCTVLAWAGLGDGLASL